VIKQSFQIIQWVAVSLALASISFATANEASNVDKYGFELIRTAAVTQGGKDGQIIRVTNLNASGPGSLRAAVETAGKRQIVFEVAGAIDLGGKTIDITEPFLTIAGHTAPSPGITLIKGGFVIRTHDVILQHLRIRVGDLDEPVRSGRDMDAITTASAYNIIVDHCTLTWATDENLSASGPRFTGQSEADWRNGTSRNILYSNNLISEGLANSTHKKGEHSKGSLIHDNVSNITIYRNLYAHNMERSPLFKGGVRGAVINNFIYNPGQRAVHYNLQGLEWGQVAPVDGAMVLEGNVMRGGPDTVADLPLFMIGGDGDIQLKRRDNIAIDKFGAKLPKLGRYASGNASIKRLSDEYGLGLDLPVMSSNDVESALLKSVGARPWDRDYHDVRVLADIAEGRGQIIDSQDQVGGYESIKPSRKAFDPSLWNIQTMEPKSLEVLDNLFQSGGT
jgi:pectate lyase